MSVNERELFVMDPERVTYYIVRFEDEVSTFKLTGICAAGRNKYEGEIFMFSGNLSTFYSDAKNLVDSMNGTGGTQVFLGPGMESEMSERSGRAHFDNQRLGSWSVCTEPYKQQLLELFERKPTNV